MGKEQFAVVNLKDGHTINWGLNNSLFLQMGDGSGKEASFDPKVTKRFLLYLTLF